MTRSLLTERFHFKFHHETRKLPVFVLRVAKSGSKLQHPHLQRNLPAGVPVSRINFPGSGHMEGHAALMSNLVKSLASEPEVAGRTLLDKTGLTGGYDFTLHWTPDSLASDTGRVNSDTQWPSLSTALKEQLGLNLAQENRAIDIIVVDSVELPSKTSNGTNCGIGSHEPSPKLLMIGILMLPMVFGLALVLASYQLSIFNARAQTPPTPAEFDVASLRPSNDFEGAALVQATPGRLTMTSILAAPLGDRVWLEELPVVWSAVLSYGQSL